MRPYKMSNDFAVRLGVILMGLHGLPQSLVVVNLSVGLDNTHKNLSAW
jgi:hypothetical protein